MKSEKQYIMTKGSLTIENIHESNRKEKAGKIGHRHGDENHIRHDNTPSAAMPHLVGTPSVKGMHLRLIIYQRIKTKIMWNRNVKTSCKKITCSYP